jgi:hypothetical protein
VKKGKSFQNKAPSWRRFLKKSKRVGGHKGLPLQKTWPFGQVKDQLFNVFPIRGIQTPSDESKDRQEDQDPYTNAHELGHHATSR